MAVRLVSGPSGALTSPSGEPVALTDWTIVMVTDRFTAHCRGRVTLAAGAWSGDRTPGAAEFHDPSGACWSGSVVVWSRNAQPGAVVEFTGVGPLPQNGRPSRSRRCRAKRPSYDLHRGGKRIGSKTFA